MIPTNHLYPAITNGNKKGLTATYYDNPNFEGEPVLERLDKTVDAIWKGTTPLTQQWGSSFSIRWTGYLVPPASGTYRIGVNGFSAYKLFIDDELIASYEHIHHPGVKSKEVELEEGRFYKIQLDYIGQGLDPQVQLLWASPNTDYQAQALQAAEKADIIIAVMGLSPNLEGEEMPVEVEGFSGGDRTDIKLPQTAGRAPQATIRFRQASCFGVVKWQCIGCKLGSRAYPGDCGSVVSR